MAPNSISGQDDRFSATGHNQTPQSHFIIDVQQVDCCIVGSGPAGAVLALLLAREGISVMLLEAHRDFDRDFRGDTLQPSANHLSQPLKNKQVQTHSWRKR